MCLSSTRKFSIVVKIVRPPGTVPRSRRIARAKTCINLPDYDFAIESNGEDENRRRKFASPVTGVQTNQARALSTIKQLFAFTRRWPRKHPDGRSSLSRSHKLWIVAWINIRKLHRRALFPGPRTNAKTDADRCRCLWIDVVKYGVKSLRSPKRSLKEGKNDRSCAYNNVICSFLFRDKTDPACGEKSSIPACGGFGKSERKTSKRVVERLISIWPSVYVRIVFFVFNGKRVYSTSYETNFLARIYFKGSGFDRSNNSYSRAFFA